MRRKNLTIFDVSSFPRRRESSYFNMFWLPASAGMTEQGTFYESINYQLLTNNV